MINIKMHKLALLLTILLFGSATNLLAESNESLANKTYQVNSIISYYDRNRNLAPYKIHNGFYRKYLATLVDGQVAVQDFYTANDNKYTDRSILSKAALAGLKIKGKVTTTEAITAPCQVKIKLMSKTSFNH